MTATVSINGVTVSGSHSVSIKNGVIMVGGSVKGNVSTMSGDIRHH